MERDERVEGEDGVIELCLFVGYCVGFGLCWALRVGYRNSYLPWRVIDITRSRDAWKRKADIRMIREDARARHSVEYWKDVADQWKLQFDAVARGEVSAVKSIVLTCEDGSQLVARDGNAARLATLIRVSGLHLFKKE